MLRSIDTLIHLREGAGGGWGGGSELAAAPCIKFQMGTCPPQTSHGNLSCTQRPAGAPLQGWP